MVDLDSEVELSVLPDRSRRPNPNPQTPIEEAGLSRFKEIIRRMSLEISSLFGEDRPHKGVDEKETSSDENPSTSAAPSAGRDETSKESSFEEL